MKRETWKVFLACAIGAGLGSLVALEVHQYFWWIGVIIGGFTGYLSYEWRAVLHAIPAAYHAVRGWHPSRGYWECFGWSFLAMFLIAFWMMVGILILLNLLSPIKLFTSAELSITISGFLGVLTSAVLISFVVALFVTNSSIDEEYKVNIRIEKAMSYYLAPPLVIFWHLPRGLIRFTPQLPKISYALAAKIILSSVRLARFLRRFSWEIFIRIHSEMRLLCGVDAMLGAAIGYGTGSTIVGAISGGLFGILNYVVVTEGWLKRRGYLPIGS